MLDVGVAVHFAAHGFPESHFAGEVTLFTENQVPELDRSDEPGHFCAAPCHLCLSLELAKNLVVHSVYLQLVPDVLLVLVANYQDDYNHGCQSGKMKLISQEDPN